MSFFQIEKAAENTQNSSELERLRITQPLDLSPLKCSFVNVARTITHRSDFVNIYKLFLLSYSKENAERNRPANGSFFPSNYLVGKKSWDCIE